MTGSAMKPHLTTSASPATKSCARQRLQRREVAQHPGRRVERPDEVLALGGVDPGLAADGGVDHGEQRRRHVDDPDAAQPGGRDEAGEVGGRPSPDADDGVGAGEAGLPEDAPEERRRPARSWPPRRRAPPRHTPRSPWPRNASRTPSPVAARARGWTTRTRWTPSPSSPGSSSSRPVPDDDVVVAADADAGGAHAWSVHAGLRSGAEERHDLVDHGGGLRPAVSTRCVASRS